MSQNIHTLMIDQRGPVARPQDEEFEEPKVPVSYVFEPEDVAGHVREWREATREQRRRALSAEARRLEQQAQRRANRNRRRQNRRNEDGNAENVQGDNVNANADEDPVCCIVCQSSAVVLRPMLCCPLTESRKNPRNWVDHQGAQFMCKRCHLGTRERETLSQRCPMCGDGRQLCSWKVFGRVYNLTTGNTSSEDEAHEDTLLDEDVDVTRSWLETADWVYEFQCTKQELIRFLRDNNRRADLMNVCLSKAPAVRACNAKARTLWTKYTEGIGLRSNGRRVREAVFPIILEHLSLGFTQSQAQEMAGIIANNAQFPPAMTNEEQAAMRIQIAVSQFQHLSQPQRTVDEIRASVRMEAQNIGLI